MLTRKEFHLFFILFLDGAFVLLWTTPVERICLWSPQTWVHMDVRLDNVLCRSRDPGNTARAKRKWLQIYTFAAY